MNKRVSKMAQRFFQCLVKLANRRRLLLPLLLLIAFLHGDGHNEFIHSMPFWQAHDEGVCRQTWRRDMRAILKHLILLLSLLTLGACESALLREGPAPAADTPVPVLRSTSDDPAEVLGAFILAWNSEDFEAMYELIANRSRELYPQRNFIDKYTVAHSVIRFDGVKHSLLGVEYQGTTAIVDYDVLIESPTFGAVADERRVMRMVNEGGWKIAWSPTDIIRGMSSRARLTERADFPDRANIYAADGSPLAEQDAPVYSLWAIQQDMRSVDVCLDTLALVTRQSILTLRRFCAVSGRDLLPCRRD